MELTKKTRPRACKMSTENYILSNRKTSIGYLNAWTETNHNFNPELYISNEIRSPKKINTNALFESTVLRIKPTLYRESNELPIELNEISEEILYSKEILQLKNDWDGEGAESIPQKVYNLSIELLINYSKFIYENLGIVIDSPEINPGRNKNIYLSWRTNNARLAISIEQNNVGDYIANYYGDLQNNKQPIKGNVPVDGISDYLAYWMKNLQ